MQIRPNAFTIGLIIHPSIALFCVYTEFGIDSIALFVLFTLKRFLNLFKLLFTLFVRQVVFEH